MVNKHLTTIVLLFGTTFCLFSCEKIVNPKERNRLIFTDNLESVADSLSVLNDMLLVTNKHFYIYAIVEDYLYVTDTNENAVRVGLLSDSLISKSESLSFISTLDRKRFIGLVAFLKRNYLSRCDIEGGQPVYMYRNNIHMAESQTDLFRFVCLFQPDQTIDSSLYKILDKHENLYLLADKDARIWSDD